MSFVKYKVQEHFFSRKKGYTITDESGRLIGTVKRHFFSPVKRATFLNEAEDEVLTISRKLFSFRKTHFIQKKGIDVFRIFRTFSLKPTVFVESLTQPDAFAIQGNIWSSEYAFYKNNAEFAYVSRNIWKLQDAYQVAIQEDEDQYLVLALVIVLSLMRKPKKSS